jgi:nitroreductase
MTAHAPARTTQAGTTLGRTVLREAIGAAVRAPSIHNTQPWVFRLYDGRVDLLGDRRRRLSVADPHGIGLRISCGAALFNLRLGITHLGREPLTALLPGPTEPALFATVVAGAARPPTPTESALFEAIPRRHSNRHPFDPAAVPPPVRNRLRDAAQIEGCWLDFLVGPGAIGMAAELVRSADRVLNRNDAYRAEVESWGQAPEQTDPAELLTWPDGEDPVVAVLGTDADAPDQDLLAGQALQRVLLTATSAGLVTSLFFQPVEVAEAREQLRMGLRRRGWPSMLIRTGYGHTTAPTPRRELREVVIVPRTAAKSAR